MTRRSKAWVTGGAWMLALAGCAPRVSSPSNAAFDSGARAPGPAATSPVPSKGTVVVDQRIASASDIPTPHFDFNSDRITGQAASALTQVADCFRDGKLAGQAVRLVGHADPRGPLIYNFGLGQLRAGSVARFLREQGLGTDRIRTTSRGELDARGTDEEGWQADRRVDIELAD